MVLALEREQRRHYPVGDVAAHVGRVIVAPSDALHRADDFEGDVVQNDGCTQGGATGKKVLDQFISQNDHVASLGFVQPVEPASRIKREISYVGELRFDAGKLS